MRAGAVTSAAIETAGSALPRTSTGFIGRREDLRRLRRLCSESRLVTVVGPAGVGKTRLVVHANSKRRPLGALWFVDLAPASDEAQMLELIALAFGREFSEPDELIASVARSSGLLILDNAEHLREKVGKIVERILDGSDGLRVQVTSRRPLGIGDEAVLRLDPLRVGDARSVAHGAALPEAVALFVERGRAVRGTYDPVAELPVIVEICRRLDGLPLAIELAAARLIALSERSLLERLEDRLHTLARADSTVPPRQRALDASIAWSYELCTRSEQRMWRWLSVFAGAFSATDVLAVMTDVGAGDDGVAADLEGLVDGSVLTRRNSSRGEEFSLLSSLREYGRTQLAVVGDEIAARSMHHRWCMDRVQAAEEQWYGPDHGEVLRASRDDLPDIRLAVSFALDSMDGATGALPLLLPLWRQVWAPAGHLDELARLLDRALSRDAESEGDRYDGAMLSLHLKGLQQGPETVRGEMDRLRIRARAAGYERCALSIEAAMAGLGLTPAEAIPAFEALRDACAEEPWILERGAVEIRLALLWDRNGRAEAPGLIASLLERSAAVGESSDRAYLLLGLVANALQQDAWDRVEELADEACRVSVEGRLPHAAQACEVLAACAVRRGDDEGARGWLDAADVVWEEFGRTRVPVPQLRGVRPPRPRSAGLAHATEASIGDGDLGREATGHREDVAGLTRREAEIAALVAAGWSDRDVADRLSISRRTVQAHLRTVYGKLGISSRRELRSPSPGHDEEA